MVRASAHVKWFVWHLTLHVFSVGSKVSIRGIHNVGQQLKQVAFRAPKMEVLMLMAIFVVGPF